MSSHQEFDILKLVELTRSNKYEMTAVGFAALDKIDKIDIPKKMKSRKFAVQALHAISEKMVQFGYFTAEERKKLQDEANLSDSPYKKDFNNVFAKSNSAAPVIEEVTEEEDIPEEEAKPVKVFSEDDESGEMDSEEDDFDDEDDEELEDDDDEDDK